MKTGVILYINNNNNILLVNWRKYGHWCGVGGYVEEAQSIKEAGIFWLKEICGLEPVIRQLRGVFTFICNDCEECTTKYYVFDAISNTTALKLTEKLHTVRWVPKDKILNYILFPNSSRYLLNTYLMNDEFFDLELEYSDKLVTKKLRYV